MNALLVKKEKNPTSKAQNIDLLNIDIDHLIRKLCQALRELF